MLNGIIFTITLEGASTVNVGSAVITATEENARQFSVVKPVEYNSLPCYARIKNSAGVTYLIEVDSVSNDFTLSGDVLTSGKLQIQFEFIDVQARYVDNTIFELFVTEAIGNPTGTTSGSFIVEVVAHMQNSLIHVPVATGHIGKVLTVNSSEIPVWQVPTGGGGSSIWGTISGDITEQTDLQLALSGKANTSHTHSESNIVDLDKYTQAQVNGLLAGKSNVGHSHNDLYYTESETNTLLSGKANTSHTHLESDITDLDKYTQSEVDALISGISTQETTRYHARPDGTTAYVKIGSITFTSSYQKYELKMEVGLSGNDRNFGEVEISIHSSGTYNTYLATTEFKSTSSLKRAFDSNQFMYVVTDTGTSYTYDIWCKVSGYASLYYLKGFEYSESNSATLTVDMFPETVTTQSTAPVGAVNFTAIRADKKYSQEYSTQTSDGASTVAIGLTYESTLDAIHVYLNGEKLIKGKDFTTTNTLITFIGFTLVTGDVIETEVFTNML